MKKPVYGLIYLITCTVLGKLYVGQTTRTLEVRWGNHLKESRRESPSIIVDLAIKKYGPENFTHQELESCQDQESLNSAEKKWISYYNSLAPNGYNLTTGGDGGYKFTPEVVTKMSSRAKKQFASSESRQKMASRLKKTYEDHPEMRAEASERTSLRFLNPDNRKRQSDTLKKFFAEHPGENSKRLKAFNSEHPEAKLENSKRIQKFFAEHPEAKQRISEAKKQLHIQNPSELERVLRMGESGRVIRWAKIKGDKEYLDKLAKAHEAIRTRGKTTLHSIARSIGLSKYIVYRIKDGTHWSSQQLNTNEHQR